MSNGSQNATKSRVNIEYEVPGADAQERVTLPFVVGVMADLSGKPAAPLPPVHEREFVEFTHENFDGRLRAAQPRVAFDVPNRLGGGGRLRVDMTFQSMADFGPGRVAETVGPLAQVLEVRRQLSDLLTNLDGNARAEEALGRLLNSPAVRRALTAPQPAGPATPAEEVR